MNPGPLGLILFSVQKVCVFTTMAYMLSRGSAFGRLLLYQPTWRDQLKVFGFFLLLAMTELTGLFILPATARDVVLPVVNSAIVSSVAAGLLAGPLVGGAVGLFSAGALNLMNMPSLSGGAGAALGGVLAGWIHLYRPTPRQRMLAGFVVGVISQAVWMAATLAAAAVDLGDAGTLSLLGPLVAADLINGLGVVAFLTIAADLKAQQERIGSQQARKALDAANRSLPLLRQGLTEESAAHIAQIVGSLAEVGAVSITDGKRVLAHYGEGQDHHTPGRAALEPGTLEDGRPAPRILRDGAQIGCEDPACPLSGALVSPLLYGREVIGTVEIYQSRGRLVGPDTAELGVGLAQFFSNYQMELAELERQTQLASQAELKALQSQVHPHFLFNVLNTLAALCELNPQQAGRITVRLGDFLRRSLREAPPPLIPLEEELRNVHAYLEIERARFQDRLRIVESIDPRCLGALVPSFGLQILAENAVLHGISQKPGGGTLRIEGRCKGGRACFRVIDDGVGLSEERLRALSQGDGRASGLLVLRERGRRVLGNGFRLRIASCSGTGVAVFLSVPLAPPMEESASLGAQAPRAAPGAEPRALMASEE